MKYKGYAYASNKKKPWPCQPWTNDSKKMCIIRFLFYEFFVFVFFSHFRFNLFALKLFLVGAANSFYMWFSIFLMHQDSRYKVRTIDIIMHGTQFCFWRPLKEFLFCFLLLYLFESALYHSLSAYFFHPIRLKTKLILFSCDQEEVKIYFPCACFQ